MKTLARSGWMTAMLFCATAVVSPAWSAEPAAAPLGKQNLQATPPKVETKIVSCAKTITVQARLDQTYLTNSIDNTAKMVNFNDVVLAIYGSKPGEVLDIDCFYKSEHGDIPNIVYRIPCKRPKKGATTYEHSYWCIKN